MSIGPVRINNLVPIVSLASRSTVCPEESFNLLLTVRPHPFFFNELSQLSVDLLLPAFTTLAVGPLVRVRQLPGDVLSPGPALFALGIDKSKSGPALAPGALLKRFFRKTLSHGYMALAIHAG